MTYIMQMPWPSDQKARTRERIVREAAAAFRARGLESVSVNDVMAAAGLTHGGFYAHFPSKDVLVAAALIVAGEEVLAFLDRGDLAKVIDAYLSPLHVAHPERGCPVAALGPELARARTLRGVLAGHLRRRLDWMRALPGAPAEDDLVATLACMIGGLILARAVGPRRERQVLAACRAFLHRATKPAPRPKEPRRRAAPAVPRDPSRPARARASRSR
jgi:AcrR family transcriptional regulator